ILRFRSDVQNTTQSGQPIPEVEQLGHEPAGLGDDMLLGLIEGLDLRGAQRESVRMDDLAVRLGLVEFAHRHTNQVPTDPDAVGEAPLAKVRWTAMPLTMDVDRRGVEEAALLVLLEELIVQVNRLST